MNLRTWLASAGWACLAGIAAQFFIAVAFVGLLLLFFGALLSALVLPFLAWLPAGWQVTGGQWLALGAGLWLAAMVLGGGVARWAWRRCRSVVLEPDAGLVVARAGAPAERPLVWSWAKRSSVLAGLFASLCFYAVVPAALWSGAALVVPPSLPAAPAATTV